MNNLAWPVRIPEGLWEVGGKKEPAVNPQEHRKNMRDATQTVSQAQD